MLERPVTEDSPQHASSSTEISPKSISSSNPSSPTTPRSDSKEEASILLIPEQTPGSPLAIKEFARFAANLVSFSKLFIKDGTLFHSSDDMRAQAEKIRQAMLALREPALHKESADDSITKKTGAELLQKDKQIDPYLASSIDDAFKIHLQDLFNQLSLLATLAYSSFEFLEKESSTGLTQAKKKFERMIDELLAVKSKKIESNKETLHKFKDELLINLDNIIERYQAVQLQKKLAEQAESIKRLELTCDAQAAQQRQLKTSLRAAHATITTQEAALATAIQEKDISQLELKRAQEETRTVKESVSRRIKEVRDYHTKASQEQEHKIEALHAKVTPKKPTSSWKKAVTIAAVTLIGAGLIAVSLFGGGPLSLGLICLIAGSALGGSGGLYGLYKGLKACFGSTPASDDPLDRSRMDLHSDAQLFPIAEEGSEFGRSSSFNSTTSDILLPVILDAPPPQPIVTKSDQELATIIEESQQKNGELASNPHGTFGKRKMTPTVRDTELTQQETYRL